MFPTDTGSCFRLCAVHALPGQPPSPTNLLSRPPLSLYWVVTVPSDYCLVPWGVWEQPCEERLWRGPPPSPTQTRRQSNCAHTHLLGSTTTRATLASLLRNPRQAPKRACRADDALTRLTLQPPDVIIAIEQRECGARKEEERRKGLDQATATRELCTPEGDGCGGWGKPALRLMLYNAGCLRI